MRPTIVKNPKPNKNGDEFPKPKRIEAKPAVKHVDKPAPEPEPEEEAEGPSLQAAQQAVATFEADLAILQEMKADWESTYEEAHQALQDVKHQEDAVQDDINRAKPLVAAVKKTVGDFLVQRKWSKAHYDGEKVVTVLDGAKDRAQIFDEMMSAGIVKGLDLDRDSSLAWFAQHPEYANRFQTAFQDEAEMTAAVTVPKIR